MRISILRKDGIQLELNERQKQILALLRSKKKITVAETAASLYASEMTIRRDLEKMEQEGILRRFHGGAVEVDSMHQPIVLRSMVNDDRKKALARKASAYLQDGQTVFLDSSSTCSYLVPYLSDFSDIQVVTNSIQSLLLLAQAHIPCFLIGGRYYEHDMCIVGPQANDFAAQFNVDIAFFSALGLSSDGRVTDTDEHQTAVRKQIMKNATQVVLMLDESKSDKIYPFTLCRQDEITAILTN